MVVLPVVVLQHHREVVVNLWLIVVLWVDNDKKTVILDNDHETFIVEVRQAPRHTVFARIKHTFIVAGCVLCRNSTLAGFHGENRPYSGVSSGAGYSWAATISP